MPGHWLKIPAPIFPQYSYLALTVFLLPTLTVHLSYLISASQGHVEWCNPYVDDCTSISNIGRRMPEAIVFKLGMIISGLCLIRFWQLSQDWLHQFQSQPPTSDKKLATIGLISGCSLILYTLGLGHEHHTAYLARRIGVVSYFGLSYIAQCLIVLKLNQQLSISGSPQPWTLRVMILLCLALLICGVSTVLLDIFTSFKERLERPLEWVTALMLALNYGLLWRTSLICQPANRGRTPTRQPRSR